MGKKRGSWRRAPVRLGALMALVLAVTLAVVVLQAGAGTAKPQVTRFAALS
jgi:hypothetical protein